MKICGLITEYNPFHNGHLYHLEQSKEKTGCDYTIAVMSGDFVQRGEPAVFDKYLRAKAALLSGVDLVLELPPSFATMSAEYFADGAIKLLASLGCVDCLCFGSESGSPELLKEISQFLIKEPEEYKLLLQTNLKNGLSFPVARQMALESLLQQTPQKDRFIKEIQSPNNLLGIEYLRALERNHSLIVPYTIQRSSPNYHSTEMVQPCCSALAIRSFLKDNPHQKIASPIAQQFPEQVLECYMEYLSEKPPLFVDDFSPYLHYALLQNKENGYTAFPDVSPSLSKRIQNTLTEYRSFTQYCSLLKTKDLTYTRISRALLHIMLGMKTTQPISYAKVLGFRKEAGAIVSKITQSSSLPILTNLSAAKEKLSPAGLEVFKEELRISEIYQSVLSTKGHLPAIPELSRKMLVI